MNASLFILVSTVSGQLPWRPDLTPAPGPWPALISDESQLCIRSKQKCINTQTNMKRNHWRMLMCERPKSAFLCWYLMNESRSQENECPAVHCLPRSHLCWCSSYHLIKCHMSALPPPVTSSLTSDWSISRHTRPWLVQTPRSLRSQFQYQGLWSAVTPPCSVASHFIASHPHLSV